MKNRQDVMVRTLSERNYIILAATIFGVCDVLLAVFVSLFAAILISVFTAIMVLIPLAAEN